MIKIIACICLVFAFAVSCKEDIPKSPTKERQKNQIISVQKMTLDTLIYTNGFDYPVGKPNANNYYNAQGFGDNLHLGDDWNGINGGNTDLGDPIYSVANGYVVFAEDINGGWGNVIRIVHYINDDKQVESLYAHCDSILVKNGAFVSKGEKIATIGTNSGQYYAHLHLEIRDTVGIPIGSGYSADTDGYLNPTKFIKANRN